MLFIKKTFFPLRAHLFAEGSYRCWQSPQGIIDVAWLKISLMHIWGCAVEGKATFIPTEEKVHYLLFEEMIGSMDGVEWAAVICGKHEPEVMSGRETLNW